MNTIKYTFLACLSIMCVGCASSLGDFNKAIEKYSDARFCALAITQTPGGSFDNLARTSRIPGYITCNSYGMDSVISSSIDSCSRMYGKECTLAFTYDRRVSKLVSHENSNISNINKKYNAAVRNALLERCDKYGFKRDTTEHADCMMRTEQNDRANYEMALMRATQQDAINQANQKQLFDQAQKLLTPPPSPIICSSQQNGPVINTICN